MANSSNNDGCFSSFASVVIFGIVINVLMYIWEICVAAWNAIGNFFATIGNAIHGFFISVGAFFSTAFAFLSSIDWFFWCGWIGAIVAIIIATKALYLGYESYAEKRREEKRWEDARIKRENKRALEKAEEERLKEEKRRYDASLEGKAKIYKAKLERAISLLGEKIKNVNADIKKHTSFYDRICERVGTFDKKADRESFIPVLKEKRRDVLNFKTYKRQLTKTKSDFRERLKVHLTRLEVIEFYGRTKNLSQELESIDTLLEKANELLNEKYIENMVFREDTKDNVQEKPIDYYLNWSKKNIGDKASEQKYDAFMAEMPAIAHPNQPLDLKFLEELKRFSN